MRILTKEQVQEILRKHKIWIEDEENEEAARANLRYADLRYADLSNANLSNANLSNADLSNANLSNANLRYADLSNANLRYANLRYADLSNANLSNADLSNANLRYADLRYADLSNANLRYADLSNANLRYANLRYADLSNANLRYADYGAIQCPETGAFVAFKKCECNRIVKLLIPEDAKRSSATTRKCRASKAIVLEISDFSGEVKYKEAQSTYDSDFIYKQDETLEIENFDDDRWNECAPGIHFFITRQEAIDY